MDNFFLTIITPTYNRANLLLSCFLSLCKQTDFSFEWIIVDDGSTDNTEDVVNEFSTTSFPIKYIKKINGGKHTALNASHSYINGEYVLILDSDDTLTYDAVYSIKNEVEIWSQNSAVGVLTFLRANTNSQTFCTVKDYNMPVDLMSYPRNSILGNDCCEVVKADLFKKYPFPVFENEKFLAEGFLWSNISYDSKCVYINKAIYICEYLDGGLTNAGRLLRIKNPMGGMCNAKAYMAAKNPIKVRIKNAVLYVCYGIFAKKSYLDILKETSYKLLTLLCFPLGILIYIIWSKKYLKLEVK